MTESLFCYLACHGFRVDLAHVNAGVVSLDAVDHQGPAVVAVVLHRHARVVGHHVSVDRQYSLRVRSQPGNLKQVIYKFNHFCLLVTK